MWHLLVLMGALFFSALLDDFPHTQKSTEHIFVLTACINCISKNYVSGLENPTEPNQIQNLDLFRRVPHNWRSLVPVFNKNFPPNQPYPHCVYTVPRLSPSLLIKFWNRFFFEVETLFKPGKQHQNRRDPFETVLCKKRPQYCGGDISRDHFDEGKKMAAISSGKRTKMLTSQSSCAIFSPKYFQFP